MKISKKSLGLIFFAVVIGTFALNTYHPFSLGTTKTTLIPPTITPVVAVPASTQNTVPIHTSVIKLTTETIKFTFLSNQKQTFSMTFPYNRTKTQTVTITFYPNTISFYGIPPKERCYMMKFEYPSTYVDQYYTITRKDEIYYPRYTDTGVYFMVDCCNGLHLFITPIEVTTDHLTIYIRGE